MNPFVSAGLLLLAAAVTAAPPERPRFNQHIRPILSDNCFYCHGPDEKHREADLRLDTRDGATRLTDGHAAIVPGKPEQSELLRRIVSHDPDERMPPPSSKKPPLSAEQVATLRRWIEQGAEYEGHWAFLPLRADRPPAVRDESSIKSPIDRFVIARLEAAGLRPSPEADRATLIRRLSLDLLGLLPPPDEVTAFVADPAADAVERLVDRLLASPHYGERWGRHWLDQARYADSNGYTIDAERDMWPFRDWVIQALNDDLPFDRFTIEQLAGDLLPNPTKSQLVATGFHRNTLINQEGGTDAEQFRNEAVVDRVNTTGAVWLGLTVGCSQCHSHKFDPISQREYYGLFAFFNQGADVNNKGPTVSVVRGEMFGRPIDIPAEPPPSLSEAEIAKLQTAWEAGELARLTKQQEETPNTPPVWTPAKYGEFTTGTTGALRRLDDNSLLVEGRPESNATYRVTATTTLPQIAAVRLRTPTHESLPKMGPGLAGHGNFVLTEFRLVAGGNAVRFARAFADHEQPGYPASDAIDDKPNTGWAINVGGGSKKKLNEDHEAVFVLAKPFVPGDEPIEFKLLHEANAGYLVGRFAIEFSATAPPAPTVESEFVTALKVAADKRSAAQKKLLREAFEKVEPRAKKKEKKSNPDVVDLMVMRDVPKPRDTFLLTRGDFLRPDKAAGPIAPGFLTAVQPLPESAPRNRLDLAQWLVHPQNPLTPRVTMNRVWMHYFGRGLVETEEDFGTQGTPPTHPELLDWLAGEFIRRGWSLKEMHRLIATSTTYRQSSRVRADLVERDPRNLLLARQERLRVEAEIVRDSALAASGLLDRTLGGPSFHPPQPDGVYAFTQGVKPWKTESGSTRYRRGMYTFFYRSAPHPLLTTFDAPDFQTVCTRRVRSNTPLQSLTLANDTAFVEIAAGMGARLLRESSGDSADAIDGRLRLAFLLALSREPSSRELSLLREFYLRQTDRFARDDALAKSFVPSDFVSSGHSPAVCAATIAAARSVLNTDNFITRE